jgi:hypothetical protein
MTALFLVSPNLRGKPLLLPLLLLLLPLPLVVREKGEQPSANTAGGLR